MFKTSVFKQIGFAGYLFLVLGLHVNALLRAEDPVRDTQTEEILYEQKLEQEKDGVKAPATPKVIYYGGQGFLTRPALTKNDEALEGVVAKKKKNIFNWSDWWDEKPSEDALPADEDSQLTEPVMEEEYEIPSPEEALGGRGPNVVQEGIDEAPAPLAGQSEEAVPENGDGSSWW